MTPFDSRVVRQLLTFGWGHCRTQRPKIDNDDERSRSIGSQTLKICGTRGWSEVKRMILKNKGPEAIVYYTQSVHGQIWM